MTTALDATISLVSLAEAKEYLKITSSGDDSILDLLINNVSQMVQRYLKRNLITTDYVEYYSGDSSLDLVLRNYPINSIASIYIDQLRQWGISNAVDVANNVIIKKKQGIIRAFNLLYGWTSGESNIKITYNAGYTVGTGGGTGTLPYDIRMAVVRILDHHYRIGYTHRKLDFQTESMQNMNTTFKDFDLPKDVKLMLDGYASPIPASQFEYAD